MPVLAATTIVTTWLYTQADRAYEGTQRGSGEFPANRVSCSTGDYEPIPGLPWCHDVRPL